MKIGIIYSSLTGNTQQIAEALAAAWPGATCVSLKDAPDPDAFDCIAIGFWAKRGTADPVMQSYMARIHDRKVVTFFTLAADPGSAHAQKCADAANQCYGENCDVLGTFWCQGALNPKIVTNYIENPERSRHPITPESLARWDKASTHPDATDLQAATDFARSLPDCFESC